MRDIKFRAKIKDIDALFRVIGIDFVNGVTVVVDEDRDGVDIYEGDIVEYKLREGHRWRGIVKYKDNGFWLDNGYFPYESKVIGNIYENSPLAPKEI